jgi:serine/threonine protein kinase
MTRLTNTNKIEKYTVVKEIGAGGFGTVYLVEHNGNQFALKQLSKGVMDPEISERFIRESLRIEELRKKYRIDYLVQIFDVLFKENAFVMEFIPESSRDYFTRNPDDEFIFYLIQCVHQLHRWGVAHRDIKPENLRAKNSKPVLIDFGVASWWDSRSHIVPTGTRFYSPPEMVSVFDEYRKLSAARHANKELIEIIRDNARERIKYIKKIHDVYSLGITTGELLTGTLPFNRESYTTYLENGDGESYQNWLESIPIRFREFVKKATRFSPVDRMNPDDLLNCLNMDRPTDVIEIREEEKGDYFRESYYKCLHCSGETLPPANFCPYCGENLSTLMLQIEPEQVIRTKNLPNSLKLTTPPLSEEAKKTITIDLAGDDFTVILGRNITDPHISFPDDNWMSGCHGRIIKEKEKIYYIDGKEGKLPTNPGVINNIPVGKSRIELFSGSFLLLGSTVFNIKKYFGKIETGRK